MATRPKMQQGLLQFPFEWGGRREGAGRKPSPGRRRVAHRKKPELEKDSPLHITIRLRDGLPSMRRKAEYRVLRAAFAAGKERFGFRLVHYSVMGNHAHLIVEADDRRALRRGMSGLMVRMARGLNRLWRRTGGVFGDHFHEQRLESPRQVRHAIAYMLHNARRHRIELPIPLDYYASGPWFDGWNIELEIVGHESWEVPVTAAQSWLLRRGWRKHGRLSPFETPAHAS